jgi:hypothetical protein
MVESDLRMLCTSYTPKASLRLSMPAGQDRMERSHRRLVAHIFFHPDANFALPVFAFAVEGWIFYTV